MSFKKILDPHKITEDPYVNKRVELLCEGFAANRSSQHFKQVNICFSAKLTKGNRLIFIKKDAETLILVKVGDHKEYEYFINDASAVSAASKCLTPEILAKAIVFTAQQPSTSEACAASAATVPSLATQKVTVTYGNEFLLLSDEQSTATKVPTDRPVLIQGPPGSGKTLVAFRLLQELAETHYLGKLPILYLGTSLLATELSNRWREWAGLPQENIIQFHSLSSLIAKLLPRPWQCSLTSFNDWFMETTPQSTNIKAKIHSKIKHLREVPIEELKIELYKEFRLITEFIIAHGRAGEIQYNQSRRTFFHDAQQSKPTLFRLFRAYTAWLERQYKVDPQVSCEQLPLLATQFSHIVIDEAQIYPPSVTQWFTTLANATYLCDPHQDTLDGTQGFLRLFNILKTRGAYNSFLTGSFRVPPEIAACANRVLLKKRDLFHGLSQHGGIAEYLSKWEDGNPGIVEWLDQHMINPAAAHAEQYDRRTDAAFIIFREADRDIVEKLFNTKQIFYPHEIQGLEYKNIFVINPLVPLKSIFKLEATGAHKREKEQIFEFAEDLRAINQLFVAITRAVDKVTFIHLTGWQNSSETEQAKRLLLGARPAVMIASPSLAPRVMARAELEQHIKNLIEAGNTKQAHAMWIANGRNQADFDLLCGDRKEASAALPVTASASPPAQEVSALFKEAKRLRKASKYREAINKYEFIIKNFTGSRAEAQYCLGLIYYNSNYSGNNISTAIKYFETAYQTSGNTHRYAAYLLALIYNNQSEWDLINDKKKAKIWIANAAQLGQTHNPADFLDENGLISFG